MERLNPKGLKRVCAVAILVAMALAASGQTVTAPTVAPTPPAAAQPTQIGTQAVDVIPLRAYVGGTPLQHGNLIPGSDRITLNGAPLASGTDYAIDNVAGVVYLKIKQSVGDSLVVSYNYDPNATKTAASAGSGFQLNMLPGVGVLMGMGLTERGPDGHITNSNVFGWKNSLSFGGKKGGTMTGLVLAADQQGGDGYSQLTQMAPSLSGPARSNGYAPTGSQNTHFVLENYKSSLMGGNMSLDVQQISQHFANFGAVTNAGYSDADVAKFKAERGLDRQGLSFSGLKFGGASFDDTSRTVKDVNGSGISWKNYGVTQGGLKLNYTSQRVDDTFSRFNDLSEADKAQLMKERGMSRQNLAGQFLNKSGTLSFQSTGISDDVMHQGIHRRDLTFDSKKMTADYGQESVDPNFLRAGSLTAAETGQYAREVGTTHSWFTFSGGTDGKTKPLTFGEMEMKGTLGKFSERDVAYSGKSWNINHIEIGSTSSFASMGALQDAAATSFSQKIGLSMGAPAAATPGDKGAFQATPGIHRDYTELGYDPAKNWHFKFDDLGLKGAHGGGKGVDGSVTDGKFVASYHKQTFDPAFTEAAGLMPIEQARLGVLPGLRKEDFSFNDQFSKVSKFSYGQMTAGAADGRADRQTLSYSTKGFQLDASQRKVDTGFMEAGQMVDPEAAILASLQGFRQRDLKFTFNKLPAVTLTGEAQDAKDQITGETKSLSNYKLVWNVDKTTQFGFTDMISTDRLPTSNVLTTDTRQFSFAKDFGKYGKFAFLDELDLDEGTSAALPTSHKDYLSYETKLSAIFSAKLEQTQTTFADHSTQGITAETISTQLTKRLGVSLTQAEITGNSKQSDPAKTNYGIWYDLGNGVRVSYGYAHQYVDGVGATTQTGLAVGKNTSVPVGGTAPAPAPAAPAPPATPGTTPPPPVSMLGPFNFTGGMGTTKYTTLPAGAASHTQGFDNMAVSTVKPFALGPLTNMKFTLGMDSATDYGTWSKNNQGADLSGQLGSNVFSIDYRGQLAAPAGEGVDKGFRLTTSKSPKAWLQASFGYKLRTLPSNVDYVIRDYSITAKPNKNLEISEVLQTNPEVVNTGVFLGSTPQASRSNKWNVAYHQTTDTTFGASYQELINSSSGLKTTTTGLNMKLFQKSGSPLTLFYGSEDILDGIDISHRITNRYSVQFDQKAGPRQTFSMFFGNLSYDFSSPSETARQNWTVRLDYQLRF